MCNQICTPSFPLLDGRSPLESPLLVKTIIKKKKVENALL